MGLAASQARFLAITARKMNCEFQSMQIAQEKLSVTRDMEQATQEYQDALSASKLVWETPDGEVYDLTYAMMMTPSNFNDYNANLITDTQGKTVLSKAMFEAAVSAGVIDEKGNPIGKYNISGRNAFLEALAARGQISQTIVDDIEALGYRGYSKSGVGGELLDKTTADVMQTSDFINYLKSAKDDKKNPIYAAFGNSDSFIENLFNGLDITKNSSGAYSNATTSSKTGKNQFTISSGPQVLNSNSINNVTMGDILAGNYSFTYNFDKASFSNGANSQSIFEDMITKIVTQFAAVLGYGGTSVPTGKGLNLDEASAEALSIAIELTKQQFSKLKQIGDPTGRTDNYNTSVYDGSMYSVNLSNMANAFLTYYAMLLDGYSDKDYSVRDEKKRSLYVTDNLNYYFAVDNIDGVSSLDMLNADFYNQMYNALCMYGASTDSVKQEMVMDKNYLNNALKNGQLFISSLNTDGYFYPGHYTLNGHVGEITDEDAIARAELEYEITKSKLNLKEESLELKMKNLDMEISSLTTEYDTVKNMISKGVEKVFTMFSS